MFLSRYLFLFLIPSYDSNFHVNHGERYINNNVHERVKRLFNFKSTTERIDFDNVLKSGLSYNDALLLSNYNAKSNKIRYPQQDLAEIKRILSKKDDDYYGILNIQKDTSKDTIIIAHRKLISIVHRLKMNQPSAAKAIQRLNGARNVLLKKFESQNQDLYQLVTKTVINAFSILNNKKNDEISNIVKTSITISTSPQSTLSQTEKKTMKTNSIDYKSHYFLLAFILLAVGIIVFITCWKKRQHRIYPLGSIGKSKKSKIPPSYDSPESDDDDDNKSMIMQDLTNKPMNKQEQSMNLIDKHLY